ncbi:hypothetical protein ABEB36_002855 [Hypothenemus hampei]|uniref:Activator of basal transcription 1 n=1 Tax=Hypothenemus hampei TaxID=57062 RepID=A0ABD1F774_HYPHA
MTAEEVPSTSNHIDGGSEKKKVSKKGLIYLSSIPPYMNVLQIREILGQYGKVGRVYLQLADKDQKVQDKKKKKKRIAKKFTEGWVEFEKKCVAKRVAAILNNTQISNRKKSKFYDYTWNMKYLSNFKWTHLSERLTYEKAERNKALKAEIQLSKKKANFFSSNIGKHKNSTVNKEYENLDEIVTDTTLDVEDERKDSRNEFLKSLIG